MLKKSDPITYNRLNNHIKYVSEYWNESQKLLISDKNLTLYSFRHYFITQRLETGVPIHLVAHICGTSVGNITRHYFHVTKEERLKASILGYMENALDAATDTTDTIS